MCEFLALPSLFHSLSQERRVSCPFSIGCPLFPQNNRVYPHSFPVWHSFRSQRAVICRSFHSFLPRELSPRGAARGNSSPIFSIVSALFARTPGVYPREQSENIVPTGRWPQVTGHWFLQPIASVATRWNNRVCNWLVG